MLVVTLYILIPVICLLGIQRRKDVQNMLDKKATLAMRGVGMLFIMFTHMAAGNICTSTYFFYISGVIGVGVCFLVSGYGLHISYKKKSSDYLTGFWLPKILRLVLPFLIAFAGWLALAIITNKEITVCKALENLLTMRFPDVTLWYLKIQLLMYAAFYFTYRFLPKMWLKIAGVFAIAIVYTVIAAIFKMGNFWYNTSLFFPLGLLLAEYQHKILPVIRKWWVLLLSGGAFVFLYGVMYFFGRLNMDYLIDNVYMCVFCLLLIWFVQHFKRLPVLEILGKYSIEIYLLHIVIGSVWFKPENPLYYILIPLICVIIGIPLQLFTSKITDVVCKKKKIGEKDADC